jgi:hypothetical protein
MKHPEPVARRLYELTEPIALVNFFSEEPNEAMVALGFRNYWDGYFAGRSAPLGRVPAEVVHAAFYIFADGEVARHIPQIWSTTTPEAAQAAREQGCVAALRTILGDLVETPECARSRPSREGLNQRPDLRSGHVRRPPCAADTRGTRGPALALGEHAARAPGDGHIAALVSERIGGVEAHVLSALGMGIFPAQSFGRIHTSPRHT